MGLFDEWMPSKPNGKIYNFGKSDRHIQTWKDFHIEGVTYPFGHLQAHKVVFNASHAVSYTV